jgi:hypothetical protein
MMADFSKWSRQNLEAVAAEMLSALLRAEKWIRVDERMHNRPSNAGNEVREVIAKAERIEDARPEISHATCDGCNTQLPSNVQQLCPECAKTLDALSEYVKQRAEVNRER